MRFLLKTLLFALVAQVVSASDEAGLHFSALSFGYRKTISVPEHYSSPFRKPIERLQQMQERERAASTSPNLGAVIGKLKELTVTGAIPGRANTPGILIVGDQVFREGDEITIPTTNSLKSKPMVDDHRVRVKSVNTEIINIAVSSSQSAQTLEVPLKLSDLFPE